MKAQVLLMVAALALQPLFAQDTTIPANAGIPPDMRDRAQHAADSLRKQWYDKAARDYLIILKVYPNCLYAWRNLGVTRYQQEHYPEALDAFLHATSLAPKDAFCQSSVGATYFQLRRYPEAAHALEIAIALNPRDINGHTFLGLAYEQMGRKAESIKEIDKAKEMENIIP